MTRRPLIWVGVFLLTLAVAWPSQAIRLVTTMAVARMKRHEGKYGEALKLYLSAQTEISLNFEDVLYYNKYGGNKDKLDYINCTKSKNWHASECRNESRFLYFLRKEIVDFVRSLGGPPPVPEQAKRLMAEGQVALETAKSRKDFREAVEAYRKAALLAPWMPAVHYNLAVVADKAGWYDEADYALRTYLYAAPDAPDAEEARRRLYLVQARAKKARRFQTEIQVVPIK